MNKQLKIIKQVWLNRLFDENAKPQLYQSVIVILLILSILSLMFAIISSFLSQDRLSEYKTTVDDLSVNFNGNVRTLAMAQREILKLIILIESDDSDVDALELQRSFVSQRMREASVEVQDITLGAELFAHNLELVHKWNNEIDQQVRSYIHTPSSLSEADQGDILANLRDLELSFNYLTAEGEIRREKKARDLRLIAEQLLTDIYNIVMILVFTLVTRHQTQVRTKTLWYRVVEC